MAFTTTLVHVAGEDNVVADAVSLLNAIVVPLSILTEDFSQSQLHDATK